MVGTMAQEELRQRTVALRQQALAACQAYHRAQATAQNLRPGEAYLPASAKVVDEADLAGLVDASLDMWLTAGRFSLQFEATLPTYFARRPKALLVNSGSSANLVAASSFASPLLKKGDLAPMLPGDEVITAAAGFPTTINPIIQNGWRPCLVDVDATTLNALPEAIKAARGPKTRAVFLAHTLGNPYQVDELASWCKQEGLFLLEDCCDAFGATISGRPVGSFGDFATLSFYPAHHITMGEGGAVLPRTSRLRRIAASLRDWGRDCWCEPGQDNTCGKRFAWKLGDLPEGYDHKYTYSSIGYNLKATDMQAALGLTQLAKVEGFIAARRRNWAHLYQGIRSSPILNEALQPTEPTPGSDPSWFGFPMLCSPGIDRHALILYLEAQRVGTRLVFAGNVVKQPAYRHVDFRIPAPLHQTDRIMHQAFWIGVHPRLDARCCDYMLEQLEAGILAQRGKHAPLAATAPQQTPAPAHAPA
jgi:CDP-6-deoxy-D-xylo-4-hexulose-3-dehydrase